MANEEHIQLLNKDVRQWNQWRNQNPTIQPDLRNADLIRAKLSGADLSGATLIRAKISEATLRSADLRSADLRSATLRSADLRSADLSGANLIRTNLSEADLIRTNLSGANLSNATLIRTNLSGADLIRTNLSGANLSGANLSGANLSGADLSGADLSGADLSGADLSGADLSGADLSNATLIRTTLNGATLNGTAMWETILDDVDLRSVKHLEQVKHHGPSGITTRTLERSQGDIPEVFLRGAGLSDTFITYLHSLFSKPIEYYTCFLSYSNQDQDFAERVYADLQSKGVRCWYAPEDLKIGDHFPDRIEQAIRTYDKLMIILSEHSVHSSWVEDEVRAAQEKEERFKQEQQLEKTVLFPVTLDKTIEHAPQQWAARLRRQRHIGDFTEWKNHDFYQKSFQRLLRDLNKAAEPQK